MNTRLLASSRTTSLDRAAAKVEALKAEGITATIETKVITSHYIVVPTVDACRADVILKAKARAEFNTRNISTYGKRGYIAPLGGKL